MSKDDLAKQIQQECHQTVEGIIEQVQDANVQDATNVFLFRKLAEIQLKMEPAYKHYGLYQLCPKCDGEGYIPGTHYNGETLSVDRTCPLCKGEGKLVRPEVP